MQAMTQSDITAMLANCARMWHEEGVSRAATLVVPLSNAVISSHGEEKHWATRARANFVGCAEGGT